MYNFKKLHTKQVTVRSSALLTMTVVLQVIAVRVNNGWLVSGKQPCFGTILFYLHLH